MKKIILSVLLLMYFWWVSAIALQDLPDDFQSHCFEYSDEIAFIWEYNTNEQIVEYKSNKYG